MDKMREEFEAWAKDKYILDVSKSGGYMAVPTKNAFDAWQASRQALVVEFTTDTYFSPYKTEIELSRDEGFDSAMEDVKAALDLAGIKYK